MSGREDELARRGEAERFRLRRAEVAEGLTALLGPRAGVTPLADAAAAAAVESEFAASHEAAEPNEWALVRREWPARDTEALSDTLHRLARNLGARPVWLVVPGRVPQGAVLTSDAVLDNPFGFAALAEGQAPELRLLDREVAAGLWLVREGHRMGTVVVQEWSLDVWGEPWLSAATRSLRGAG
jgi:hypothetical protein